MSATAGHDGSKRYAFTHSNLLYHIVFSTKHREPLIGDAFQDELYKYIGGIIRNEGGLPLEVGGIDDHVHLLAKFKPATSISHMMQKIKGSSSKWINDKQFIEKRFSWQEGYGAFTVSESQVPSVRDYIRKQPEHHRRQTFKEELVAMLERNSIEYDERFLWE